MTLSNETKKLLAAAWEVICWVIVVVFIFGALFWAPDIGGRYDPESEWYQREQRGWNGGK